MFYMPENKFVTVDFTRTRFRPKATITAFRLLYFAGSFYFIEEKNEVRLKYIQEDAVLIVQ